MIIKNHILGVLLVSFTSFSSAQESISNTASATGEGFATASDTVVIQAISEADLFITSIDSPDPVTIGENITYDIGVTNDGPSNATNVVIDNTLPSGVTFVSATPSVGGSCTTPAVGATGPVSCSFAGDTAPTAGHTLSLIVNVDSGLASESTIDNIVTTSSDTTDTDTTNNEANNATTLLIPDTPPPVVQEVPLLNPVAVILLALMLMMVVFVTKRAHSPTS